VLDAIKYIPWGKTDNTLKIESDGFEGLHVTRFGIA